MLDVKLPQLGETVTEATVTVWFKKVGDNVALDEPLCEVSTDKVDTEIPCPSSGVLAEIVVQAGDTVPTAAVIARIETEPSPVAAIIPSAVSQPVVPSAAEVALVAVAEAAVAQVALGQVEILPVVLDVPAFIADVVVHAPSTTPNITPRVEPDTAVLAPGWWTVKDGDGAALLQQEPVAVSTQLAQPPITPVQVSNLSTQPSAVEQFPTPGTNAATSVASVTVMLDVAKVKGVLAQASLERLLTVVAARVVADVRRENGDCTPTSAAIATNFAIHRELAVKVQAVDLLLLHAAFAALDAAGLKTQTGQLTPADIQLADVVVFSSASAETVTPPHVAQFLTLGLGTPTTRPAIVASAIVFSETATLTLVAKSVSFADDCATRIKTMFETHNWLAELPATRS